MLVNVIEAERVDGSDRRRWHRARVRLPLRLIDTEGDFRVLVGETVDLGVGGARVLVDGPLPGALRATVQLELSDGPALLCEATVAGGGAVEDGWEYRLAFADLEVHEVEALEQVVRGAPL